MNGKDKTVKEGRMRKNEVKKRAGQYKRKKNGDKIKER